MIILNLLIGFWLLIVVPGFVYAVQLRRHAQAALVWLTAEGLNGYRKIAADGAIYRGQIRIFIFGCMVLMGVDAAVMQFFPPGSEIRTVLSALFRLLFILMALAFSYKSYLEQHELDLLVNEDQRRRVSRVYQVEHGDE